MSKRNAVILLIAVLVVAFWFLRSKPEAPPAASFIPKEDEPAPIPDPLPAPAVKPEQVARTPEPTDVLPPLSEAEVAKKRSIAKSALASGYTASRAFHAEYNRYSTDLMALGWQPPESWMDFKVGFTAPFTPNTYVNIGQQSEDPRRMDSDVFLREKNYAGEAFAYRGPAGGLRLSDYEKYCRAGCTANETGFEMMIAVPLDDNGRVDIWTINHKKEMTLVLDGTQPVP